MDQKITINDMPKTPAPLAAAGAFFVKGERHQFAVYYRKPEVLDRYAPPTTTGDINRAYAFIKLEWAGDLEDLYLKMQGEQWSPNGEARELIAPLGVWHTSMDVGDIAIDLATSRVYIVASIGWKELAIE